MSREAVLRMLGRCFGHVHGQRARLPLRQPDGALQTVETVELPLSKRQSDGAEKTVDVDTDDTLETVDVDMGSNS